MLQLESLQSQPKSILKGSQSDDRGGSYEDDKLSSRHSEIFIRPILKQALPQEKDFLDSETE